MNDMHHYDYAVMTDWLTTTTHPNLMTAVYLSGFRQASHRQPLTPSSIIIPAAQMRLSQI